LAIFSLANSLGLWEVSALHDRPVELFKGQASESVKEGQIELPFMSVAAHVGQDYASTFLSLKAHPVGLVREKLRLLHILSIEELTGVKGGIAVKAAGLVTIRQRPGTAKGVCFITIEDETGFTNLVVFEKLFEQYRKAIMGAKLLMVEGKLQREGEVTHVIVQRCFDVTYLLSALTANDNENQLVLTLSPSNEKGLIPAEDKRTQKLETVQKGVFPAARNFK